QLTAFESQLQSVQNQLTSKDTLINCLSERIDHLEKGSTDGTLIWKIGNFKDLRRQAVSEQTRSISSPLFYTDKTGYKLSVRLYLNGDSIGKGTHVSIFLVIMRGMYDALLVWPFKHQILFELLDQSGSRKHIKDSFTPDPSNSSFHRPTSDSNKATGFPMFCPAKLLDGPNDYVKDDVIFIRTAVSLEDDSNKNY
ncbi:hypothetical protein HELRODRAFT_75703, partial [Helobdella robusta]|uniref:MATH domain-containing protein n=1 Tax=Helobdella robusta TaxID=6412 RepID=T1G293_HELRO